MTDAKNVVIQDGLQDFNWTVLESKTGRTKRTKLDGISDRKIEKIQN